MSGSLTPTVAAAPSTVQVAAEAIALIAAQTNVPTDYNVGSNVRTMLEAQGSVVELQALSDQAMAFQALVYGAMSLFGVTQSSGNVATGVVTFATSFPVSSAANVSQAVLIPSGTLVQTAGGIQFTTYSNITLASGTNSITAGVFAVQPGIAGNVVASAITGTPLTSIGYPLYVTNANATAGGANAGSQSTALALFTAKAASLGLCTPVSIANAVVGVVATGTGETVQFGACYDDKTEILTANGWYKFSELPYGIHVATLNPDTHELEYQMPSAYQAFPYSGEMVRINGRFLDMCVTPDHRMYVKARGGNKWGFTKADSLAKNSMFMRNCKNSETDVDFFQIGKHRIAADLWLEFLGYYVSEGCVGRYESIRKNSREKRRAGTKCVAYSLQIRQHDPKARAKIKKCLERLPLTVHEWGTGLSAHSKDLFEHLIALGKACDKRLPVYAKNLSARQSKILLDALIEGDGFDGRVNTKNHHTEVMYFTASKQLADDVQEIAMRAGLAASIKEDNRIGREVNIKGRGVTGHTSCTQYRVTIHQQLFTHTVGENMSREHYEGRVYCVTVPNHIIYVRRNGKVCWNGQCYEPWIAAGSGAGSGTAGYTVYIDNGTGGASAALIAATQAWLSGSQIANQSGFRPAGVPYTVSGVTPVYATVVVSGTLFPGLFGSGSVAAAAVSGITAYFNTLGICAPNSSGVPLNYALQPQVAAAAADAGLGSFSSLTVNLYYTASSGSAVSLVSGGVGTRVILSSLSVNITP